MMRSAENFLDLNNYLKFTEEEPQRSPLLCPIRDRRQPLGKLAHRAF